MKKVILVMALFITQSIVTVQAQDAVLAAQNPEALFTSPDARLHKNKQVVYHIVKDLLESNHWDLADKYISERYIQHNPNAGNGRQAVVKFFTEVSNGFRISVRSMSANRLRLGNL